VCSFVTISTLGQGQREFLVLETGSGQLDLVQCVCKKRFYCVYYFLPSEDIYTLIARSCLASAKWKVSTSFYKQQTWLQLTQVEEAESRHVGWIRTPVSTPLLR